MKHSMASALLAAGVACAAGASAQTRAPAAAPAPAPAPVTAQDRADIDRQQIIGNRELPKVLYIVPWKKPLPGDLAGRPGGGLLDEALAPIDRDVFRRQIQYGAQATAPTKP
ncbi:MAG: hypothetical protein AB7U92_06305 [Piscinibacter sp.]|uniref:hypothetical protein n=1 Tax=Piscinibacter sp. TaxID=1903157 RepID=UPI003D0B8177